MLPKQVPITVLVCEFVVNFNFKIWNLKYFENNFYFYDSNDLYCECVLSDFTARIIRLKPPHNCHFLAYDFCTLENCHFLSFDSCT